MGRNPYLLLMGLQTDIATLEITVEASPKLRPEATCDNAIPHIYRKDSRGYHGGIYIAASFAVLFTISRKLDQLPGKGECGTCAQWIFLSHK